MILYYNLKLKIDNGYRCGCCYRDWYNESNISINVDKDEKFFQKKSNHESIFDELSEIIFEEGCKIIKSLYGCYEFAKDFILEYSFYSEDLESVVEFEFDSDEYFQNSNLSERWKKVELDEKVKAEEKSKEDRIKSLERELKQLKQ